jgi:hypothetical protein
MVSLGLTPSAVGKTDPSTTKDVLRVAKPVLWIDRMADRIGAHAAPPIWWAVKMTCSCGPLGAPASSRFRFALARHLDPLPWQRDDRELAPAASGLRVIVAMASFIARTSRGEKRVVRPGRPSLASRTTPPGRPRATRRHQSDEPAHVLHVLHVHELIAPKAESADDASTGWSGGHSRK